MQKMFEHAVEPEGLRFGKFLPILSSCPYRHRLIQGNLYPVQLLLLDSLVLSTLGKVESNPLDSPKPKTSIPSPTKFESRSLQRLARHCAHPHHPRLQNYLLTSSCSTFNLVLPFLLPTTPIDTILSLSTSMRTFDTTPTPRFPLSSPTRLVHPPCHERHPRARLRHPSPFSIHPKKLETLHRLSRIGLMVCTSRKFALLQQSRHKQFPQQTSTPLLPIPPNLHHTRRISIRKHTLSAHIPSLHLGKGIVDQFLFFCPKLSFSH